MYRHSLSTLVLLTVSFARVPIPTADYAWLANTTSAFLRGCELLAITNTTLFTPDASSSYGAQWTRDFTMALSSAPSLFRGLGVNVSASVEYTLSRVEPSGRVPDRVQANGEAIFSPGGGGWPITLAWDNMPYAGLLLAAYAGAWDDAPFFCAWEPTAARALAFIPLVRGLAWNDPAAPNCSFGFEDSVVVPGRQLTVSLLVHDAATRLGALAAATGCGDAARYGSLAAAVAGAVDDLFDASTGLFLASDTLETLPDVFGSAYLVALNLSTPARRAGVGAFLAAQWRASGGHPTTTIFQEGQVRHLPQPALWKACWGACPAPGTYQNGAFWATPLNWVLASLEQTGFAEEARGVAAAAVASFRAGGVMECINRDKAYAGVRDYVASAANVFGAVTPTA